MNAAFSLVSEFTSRPALIAIGVPLVACAPAWLFSRLSVSAATRHLLWLLAFVVMGVCGLLAFANLQVPLPILPATPPAPRVLPVSLPSPSAATSVIVQTNAVPRLTVDADKTPTMPPAHTSHPVVAPAHQHRIACMWWMPDAHSLRCPGRALRRRGRGVRQGPHHLLVSLHHP